MCVLVAPLASRSTRVGWGPPRQTIPESRVALHVEDPRLSPPSLLEARGGPQRDSLVQFSDIALEGTYYFHEVVLNMYL